jgi:transcriptional regulator with XRE-family HTH domain
MPNEWERAICSRVKTVRLSIKWTQAAFAEQIGLTRDQLANIECGRTPLRYEIAWNLRREFGIGLRWLEAADGFADAPENDNLPIPGATGLSARALLSEVAHKFPESGENLVSIGPNKDQNSIDVADRPFPKTQEDLLESLMGTLEGDESKTGLVDISNRELTESNLRILLGDWIARIPLGHVYEFSEKLNQFAEHFIRSLPAELPRVIDGRSEKIMWERIKRANARKILVASEVLKKDLTDASELRKVDGVKSEIQKLLARVRVLVSAKGMKAKLAAKLEVPQSRLSEWLGGKCEPSGETTLRLLHWVEQQECQK